MQVVTRAAGELSPGALLESIRLEQGQPLYLRKTDDGSKIVWGKKSNTWKVIGDIKLHTLSIVDGLPLYMTFFKGGLYAVYGKQMFGPYYGMEEIHGAPGRIPLVTTCVNQYGITNPHGMQVHWGDKHSRPFGRLLVMTPVVVNGEIAAAIADPAPIILIGEHEYFRDEILHLDVIEDKPVWVARRDETYEVVFNYRVIFERRFDAVTIGQVNGATIDLIARKGNTIELVSLKP